MSSMRVPYRGDALQGFGFRTVCVKLIDAAKPLSSPRRGRCRLPSPNGRLARQLLGAAHGGQGAGEQFPRDLVRLPFFAELLSEIIQSLLQR